MKRCLKRRLLNRAAKPYARTFFTNYFWARGKLGGDPVFPALLDGHIFSDGTRVLDLGCGRGLLAAWMLAAEKMAHEGHWLAPCTPPRALQFRGVEMIAREVHCGNVALQAAHGNRVTLAVGDMRDADITDVDAVTILDALHYISHAEQERLLDRIRAALGAGGLFVTRVGDASKGWRFRFSQKVDACMSALQGHRAPPTWCRPLAEWQHALEARGFSVQVLPMSQGTWFANALLICRVI